MKAAGDTKRSGAKEGGPAPGSTASKVSGSPRLASAARAKPRRLYGVARERFIPFSRAFPTPERPYGITDSRVIEKIIERDAGKPLALDAPIPEA